MFLGSFNYSAHMELQACSITHSRYQILVKQLSAAMEFYRHLHDVPSITRKSFASPSADTLYYNR